jgi:hypothetical protein
LIIWGLYADLKHLGDQNHREKSCCVASEFIALSLLVGICLDFDIYYSGYIQTNCQKNKKIKRTDQILPEVYGTTLLVLGSTRTVLEPTIYYTRGERANHYATDAVIYNGNMCIYI